MNIVSKKTTVDIIWIVSGSTLFIAILSGFQSVEYKASNDAPDVDNDKHIPSIIMNHTCAVIMI